jgi:hypothetical protein
MGEGARCVSLGPLSRDVAHSKFILANGHSVMRWPFVCGGWEACLGVFQPFA